MNRPNKSPKKCGGLLLFHGAGGDRNHHTLKAIEQAVEEIVSVPVARINFTYREESTGPRPPARMPKLVADVHQAIEKYAATWNVEPGNLLLGGRSLGGRVCSIVATGTQVAGLVLLSYPLHPPRKPEKLRVEHFPQIDCPVLLVQGNKDPFGTQEEFDQHMPTIPGPVTQKWLEANHNPTIKHDPIIVTSLLEWIETTGT